MRSESRAIVLAVIAALTLAAPPVVAARDVKRCGITIRAGKTGTLVKDVACGYHCTADPTVACAPEDPGDDPTCPLPGESSSCAPDAITLERNATLDLNGFQFIPAYQEAKGIVCEPGRRGRCTIVGPGIIQGGKQASIEANDMDLVLKDLTIRRMYKAILVKGKINLENVQLQNLVGLHAANGIRAKNVTIDVDSGLGSGKDLHADGVVSDGFLGADGAMRVRRSTIKSGSVVVGRDVFLSDTSVLPDPGSDTVAFNVDAERQLVLRRSSARGIKSGQEPKLVDASCVKSLRNGDVGSWGICTDD